MARGSSAKSAFGGTGIILAALHFAADKHRDQRRKDANASPYINHPIALAELLWREGGVRDTRVIAAALLHDTIEDTNTTAAELRRHFGREIAGIVLEVTDDTSLPREERKQLQIEHARHASRRAKLVKLADKICNVRDILTHPPKEWPLETKQRYFDWAKAVVDQVRSVSPPLAREFDRVYRKRPK
jgi:guanosine-3',5'-bis(diphosphate) 3'-pyrophosphohydrolase